MLGCNNCFLSISDSGDAMCVNKTAGNDEMITVRSLTFFTYICRHEIFPEFSGIPEFSRPQRSFSWKSQIRFNIYGGGGGGTIYSVCLLSVSNAGTARHKSSQASGVYSMSTFTSIYYNSLIFCIVCVCTSLLILKTVVCQFKTISGYYSDHCLYVLLL